MKLCTVWTLMWTLVGHCIPQPQLSTEATHVHTHKCAGAYEFTRVHIQLPQRMTTSCQKQPLHFPNFPVTNLKRDPLNSAIPPRIHMQSLRHVPSHSAYQRKLWHLTHHVPNTPHCIAHTQTHTHTPPHTPTHTHTHPHTPTHTHTHPHTHTHTHPHTPCLEAQCHPVARWLFMRGLPLPRGFKAHPP